MKLFEIHDIEPGAYKSRVRPFFINDAVATLKRECAQALQQWDKSPLYRGGYFSFEKGIGFGESIAETPRQSANTSNFYTLWIDNSPLWKDFPKRSKSFIGSSSWRISSGYGDISLMIPFDSAKIGVCPADDLWFSFGDQHLEDLMTFCQRALRLVFPDEKIPETYEALRSLFSKINYKNLTKATEEFVDSDAAHLRYAAQGIISSQRAGILKSGETLADMMDRILKPKGFKSFSGKDFVAPTDKEVFIEGKCMFIIPSYLSAEELKVLSEEFAQYKNLVKIMKELNG